MFSRPTVFVVGAGASAEFGMPVGSELAQRIGTATRFAFDPRTGRIGGGGDNELLMELTNNGQKDYADYAGAAAIINRGIPFANSIDDFIDIHRENPFLVRWGKCAIVKQILEAERNTHLATNPMDANSEIEFGALGNTWLFKLVKMLSSGASPSTVFDNVSFIVFNYDRCIERFLAGAIRRFLNLTQDQMLAAMSRLNIFHPYGAVGPLPELNDGKGVPFGVANAKALTLSDSIRTYSETVSDEAQRREVCELVEESKQIVFLGFGFHRQNLAYITPERGIQSKPMFATGCGIIETDLFGVRRRIAHHVVRQEQPHFLTSPEFHIRAGSTCRELMDAYRTTLVD